MSTKKEKAVLITGCSAGGIGFHLAKEYHLQGLRVFATARRIEAMEELEALGITCLELDVTQIQSIKQVRDEVSRITGGTLHVLVNNAGQSYSLPFPDVDMDRVRAMFDVNVFGVMMVTQEFIKLLVAGGDGRIVNIGSIAAVMPLAFGSTYSAAKGALHAWGNTLRVELEPFNVKVITVVTGGVKSNISAPSHRVELPPDSLYMPMNDDFIEKRRGRSQQNALPTALYAQTVVAATLKNHPKYSIG
ncbi:NAD(P)-binding protein [Hysterangium stoloniferum]|nr:NAD(P)-binding protein [Hysterangium stoloniferum]